MPRGRMISSSLGSSRKLSELPGISGNLCDFCQALYPLIVVNTDDFGRMDADAFTIKFRVFPVSTHSEADFEDALQFLFQARLIVLYEVQGKRYLQVTSFDDHQTGLHKRTKSRIPDPPSSVKFPEIPGNSRSTEQNRTEQKRRERGQPQAVAPSPVKAPKAVSDPLMQNTAVVAYRDEYRRWPSPGKPRAMIANTVRDLSVWTDVLEKWHARGHNPNNIEGQLEWYVRGIPNYGNGKNVEPPEKQIKYANQAEIDQYEADRKEKNSA